MLSISGMHPTHRRHGRNCVKTTQPQAKAIKLMHNVLNVCKDCTPQYLNNIYFLSLAHFFCKCGLFFLFIIFFLVLFLYFCCSICYLFRIIGDQARHAPEKNNKTKPNKNSKLIDKRCINKKSWKIWKICRTAINFYMKME